jgi:hypothetical protein
VAGQAIGVDSDTAAMFVRGDIARANRLRQLKDRMLCVAACAGKYLTHRSNVPHICRHLSPRAGPLVLVKSPFQIARDPALNCRLTRASLWKLCTNIRYNVTPRVWVTATVLRPPRYPRRIDCSAPPLVLSTNVAKRWVHLARLTPGNGADVAPTRTTHFGAKSVEW